MRWSASASTTTSTRSACTTTNSHRPTTSRSATSSRRAAVRLSVDSGPIEGDLVVPDGARGVVVFAHGSGSSRHSSRNKRVASALQDAGFGTLLFDLLTAAEEAIDERTRALRFDIGLLGERL